MLLKCEELIMEKKKKLLDLVRDKIRLTSALGVL